MCSLTSLLVFSVPFCATAQAVDSFGQGSVLLADAIDTFNERAVKDPIGKDQPPLTEEEVIAAIRAWQPTNASPVSDHLYQAFKQIAETRRLPAEASFETLTGHDPGGAFVFDVWSVRIIMDRPDRSSEGFNIRHRMIGSRSLEEELVLAEQRLKDTPPLPGRYRLEERVNAVKARIARMKENAK